MTDYTGMDGERMFGQANKVNTITITPEITYKVTVGGLVPQTVAKNLSMQEAMVVAQELERLYPEATFSIGE